MPTRSRAISVLAPSRRAIAYVALFAVVALGGRAGAAEPALGPAVLMHAHGDALALWDSTNDLTRLVARKASAEETMRRLESDALTVLVKKTNVLKDDATTLTLTTIYQRTGAISPQYHLATFLGVEKLFTIKTTVADAKANGAAWARELRAGTVPSGVTIVVMGKLPPELT